VSNDSKLYLEHRSRKNPSKLIFGNCQLSPPLGILIGKMQLGKAADLTLTMPCVDRLGPDIQEHTPGFLATPKNRVTAKPIIALELLQQSHTKQQQPDQQSPKEFRLLL